MLRLSHDNALVVLDHKCRFRPTASPPIPHQRLLSVDALTEIWRTLDATPVDADNRYLLQPTHGHAKLDEAIVHLQFDTCRPNLATYARLFPNTQMVECRDLYIRLSQAMRFNAPSLQGLIIWDSMFEGDALGCILAGAPQLTHLAIGGRSSDAFMWYVSTAGYSMPAPRFGPNLRWLMLDIMSASVSYHILSWAHRTPYSIPLVTLRVRLSVFYAMTLWAMNNICKATLRDLQLYWVDRHYRPTGPQEPESELSSDTVHLDLQVLRELRHVRFIVHIAYFKDAIWNIRDVSSSHLAAIDIALIVHSSSDSITPLEELERMYARGKFSALKRIRIVIVFDDDFMGDQDTLRLAFGFTTTVHCRELMKHNIIQFAVGSYDREVRPFIEPSTPQCTIPTPDV